MISTKQINENDIDLCYELDLNTISLWTRKQWASEFKKQGTKIVGLLIDNIVDHIDHICQIAGNSDHVMIGSDLDGGFGTEQCPSDLDTIADLQKLDSILENRGYEKNDIKKILSQNGINFLLSNLPY